jgi:hypothetical protein
MIIVTETADGFRATVGVQLSLAKGEYLIFHYFFLPEDWLVRLLLRNAIKRMSKAEIKEEVDARHTNVHAVMQECCKRPAQVREKYVA